MMRIARPWWLLLVLGVLSLAAGCPVAEDDTADGVSVGETAAAEEASFDPAEPIPAEHPLIEYAGLKLGMSSVALSQVYNAPDGYGEGFTRVLERHGSSVNQIITFDPAEDGTERTLTCALYRDQLFLIVDRREGLSAEKATEWRAQVAEQFRLEAEETLPEAQWYWGRGHDVEAVFTQDNTTPSMMTANLVIMHRPTRKAWHAYNEAYDARHAGE